MKSLRFLVFPMCAALCAALLAHNAIDIAGDYLLPHDTYDDLAHGSRLLLGGGIVAIALTIVATALRAAIFEARGREAAFCEALRAFGPRDGRAFYATVIGGTFATLVLMQIFDGVMAGRIADDLSDLFGGSIALGATCASFAALLTGVLSRTLYTRLGAFRRVAMALAMTIVRRADSRERGRRIAHRPRRRSPAAVIHIARDCAGRAPPHLTNARRIF